MSKKLAQQEEHLVELVHFLAFGNRKQPGLSLKEVKRFLTTKIKDRGGLTPLECLEKDGRTFINELKTYVNALETQLGSDKARE